ncbi:MAG TPA: hypothetical protein VLT33_31800 [Labilithrix sp.]|nr:hypothetical protein [Labilithrix sp.]
MAAGLACSVSTTTGGPEAVSPEEAGAPAEAAAPGDGAVGAPLLWERRFNEAPIHAMAVTEAGDIFIIGELNGPTDFGAGVVTPAAGEVSYLAKLGSDGKLAWSKPLRGTTAMQQDWSLAADAAGGVYVAGVVSGLVNLGGADIELGFSAPGSTSVVFAHFDKAGAHVESSPILDCRGKCEKALISATAKGVVVLMTSTDAVQTPFVLGGTQTVYNGAGIFMFQRASDGSASTGTTGASGRGFGLGQDTATGRIYVATASGTTSRITERAWTGASTDDWDYTSADLHGFAIDDSKRTFLSGYFPGGNNGAKQLVQTLGPTVEWNKGVLVTGDASVTLRDSTVVYDAQSETSIFAGDFTGKITIDGVDFATKSAPGKDDVDIFVVRFDHAGKMIGHQQLGDGSHEKAVGVALLPNHRVVVAGESNNKGYLTAISL